MKNMKKYIYGLLAVLSVAAISACGEKEGSEPGNDSNPFILVNSCELGESYDPDCDVAVRFAVNDVTSSVYFLSEKTSDYESRLKSLGESGYAEYVKTNGTQLSTSVATGPTGDSIYETTLTSLYGDYTIVGVAFGKGSEYDLNATTFTGVRCCCRNIPSDGQHKRDWRHGLGWKDESVLWNDVVAGTYRLMDNTNVIGAMGWGGRTKATTLQVSSIDSKKFRFKDLYGKNAHLYFTLNGNEGKDDDGHFRNFSMTAHSTSAQFGKYGTLMIRDVATWQGDAGYESDNCLYDDNTVYAYVEYYVTAGRVAYGYDAFFPE
jgi:hypothetical protein